MRLPWALTKGMASARPEASGLCRRSASSAAAHSAVAGAEPFHQNVLVLDPHHSGDVDVLRPPTGEEFVQQVLAHLHRHGDAGGRTAAIGDQQIFALADALETLFRAEVAGEHLLCRLPYRVTATRPAVVQANAQSLQGEHGRGAGGDLQRIGVAIERRRPRHALAGIEADCLTHGLGHRPVDPSHCI
jgi:hypothetical protein